MTNLASRLCAGAQPGQILVSARVATAVEATVEVEELGPVALRGLARPVQGFSVRSLRGGA